jgi:hypothetical protein
VSRPHNNVAARAAAMGVRRGHEKRVLVCLDCVREEDFVFGGVHSDRPCARCPKPSIGPGAVVGASPWAGGIPFG